MMNIKRMLTFAVILLHSACTTEKEASLTVFYNGCKEFETVYDLEYSIKNNKDYLKEKGIALEIDTVRDKCGYLLEYQHKEEYIESVLTDFDLKQKIKKFYNIE